MFKPKFAIRKVGLGMAAVLLLLMPACQRASQPEDQAPEVILNLAVQPSPPAVGDAVLQLELDDAAGSAIEGASLEVRGDMSHAGMTPEFGLAVEAAPGIYEAPFSWSMGGDWILTVSGQLPDGRQIVRTFDRSVSANGAEGEMDMPE